MCIHPNFFVGVKGLYKLVLTTCGREVGSLVMFRTGLKDLAKKKCCGKWKKIHPTCLQNRVVDQRAELTAVGNRFS